jgi:hypothetical protein
MHNLPSPFTRTVVAGLLALAAAPHVAAQTIAQLEDRIRKLEALISAREGGGTIVRAPFLIVDTAGHTLVEVARHGDTESLILGPSAGNRVVLSRTGGHANVIAANPGKLAIMSSAADGAHLQISNQNVVTRMGAGHGNEQGFFVGEAQVPPKPGGPAPKPAAVFAELAARQGETAVLRLRDMQGQTVVAAGSNKARNGVGQVGINAPGQKIGLLLTTGPTGDGDISVYNSKAGKEVFRLDAQEYLFRLFNRSGTSAATVGLGQDGAGSGGNFTAYSSQGGVFSAGALSGTGGAVCAIHPKRGNVCLF